MRRKRIQGVCFAAVLFFQICFPRFSLGQETPDSLRSQADINIKTAFELMNEAQALIKSGVTKEKAAVLISLYTRAGQLFEKSATIYKALEPYQYASKQDVRNCEDAVKNCVQLIKDVRQRFRL